MDYYSDVYSSPEKYGLRIVGDVNQGASYEFDMFVVWQDTETGELYYASDSGCSCPSPFETFDKLEDLSKTISKQEVHYALDAWSDGSQQADVVDLHVAIASL